MTLTRKKDKIDYVHWDDPNELLDRLRLLMASQRVGNSGHTNEIDVYKRQHTHTHTQHNLHMLG